MDFKFRTHIHCGPQRTLSKNCSENGLNWLKTKKHLKKKHFLKFSTNWQPVERVAGVLYQLQKQKPDSSSDFKSNTHN